MSAGLRADRHPNADFAAALQYRVVEHTIQADTREQQRNHGEEQRQHRQQPLADSLRVRHFLLGSDVADAKFRPRARHFPAQDRSHRQRVGARGAHHEGRGADWLRRALAFDSMERHISHRHNCSAHVAVGGIADHADHLEVN